jgi:EpsI family protein
MQIGDLKARDVPMDDRVLSVLAVDDYVNREYIGPGALMALYVGFYQSQREGNTIHSPMNCLPGAGWDPVSRSYISIPVASAGATRAVQINRITIEKGTDRAVVLYWYQAHGRVVANEYWGKVYSVIDAMRLNRTDGAMVRIVSPIAGTGSEAESKAEQQAISFARSIFPLLSTYLPE